MPLSEIQRIVQEVCKEVAQQSHDGTRSLTSRDACFTTGDEILDEALGGGIRTNMVWEICGERCVVLPFNEIYAQSDLSAAGKTQLALQLALSVQLPEDEGGLSGSACFLSTHAKLPTSRFMQIVESHPKLIADHCGLNDIHTMAVPTVDILLHALKNALPSLITSVARDGTRKPVRVVIIDSLSALFTASDKPSTTSLSERAKSLTAISSIMHGMVSQHNLAFVVVNAVKDVFFRHSSGTNGEGKNDIIYSQQSRWFNSDLAAPGGHLKEATLGLVWANQLNARIMLTRTNRRRAVEEESRPSKRRRTGSSEGSEVIRVDDSVLLRRFAVLFSSVGAPRSVDFIITESGVFGRTEERPEGYPINTTIIPEEGPSNPSGANANDRGTGTGGELDEIGDDSIYWNSFDEFTKDELLSIDFDGLDEANINEKLRASQVEASDL